MALHDEVCAKIGISRNDLADLFGISKSTIDSWSNPRRMSKVTKIALELMLENCGLKLIIEKNLEAQKSMMDYGRQENIADIFVSKDHEEVIGRIKFILSEFGMNTLIASKYLDVSFEKLDKLLMFKQYPTLEFLDKFSIDFGISKDWLLGQINKSPFNKPLIESRSIKQLMEEMRKFKNVFIVRSDNNKNYTRIVIQDENNFYDIFETCFCIGDFIMEASESSDLFALYQFYKKNRYCMRLLEFNQDDFNKMMSGEFYIGNIIEKGEHSYLLESLFDLEIDHPSYSELGFFKQCVNILISEIQSQKNKIG